jgi:nitrate/nitrite transport system substrate-binding protein
LLPFEKGRFWMRKRTGFLRIFSLGMFWVSFLWLQGCNSRMEQLEADAKSILATAEQASRVEASAPKYELEKNTVKLGFIKLTDCAPLVIAKEKGFFSDEGLQVELEAQSNWKVLLDRVIDGQLDGAHMLAGQPIGASIGLGTKSPIITACSLDYGGNAITVSNEVWEQMQHADPSLAGPTPAHPISAAALKPAIEQAKSLGTSFNFGMVFPLSTHNYELRYWLAAGGIKPGMYTAEDVNGTTDGDVQISVTPPPQMPSTMEAGTIKGYCVGEPWNQLAVAKGIGSILITDQQIWKDNPEKVFGVAESWNQRNPNTHIAIVKALLRAGKWLDEKNVDGSFKNRKEAVAILSLPSYVGADEPVIAASMLGKYRFQQNDIRDLPDFVNFFDGYATYPHYSDCIWYLTQMRRWGQIADPKPDQWYHDTAKSVYRPEIYRQAAKQLEAEGKLSSSEFPAADYDGYRTASNKFIDGKSYDGRSPTEYLKQFHIGNSN